MLKNKITLLLLVTQDFVESSANRVGPAQANHYKLLIPVTHVLSVFKYVTTGGFQGH
jgi:hypothetical protein